LGPAELLAAGTWTPRGLLVPAPAPLAWARSHAMVPFAEPRADGSVRVWLTARDEDGRSHIGWALVDPEAARVEAYSKRAVLDPGPLGAFDDAGVMTSCLVRRGDELWLYYIGWTRGVSVPFYTFVGLAVSTDDGASFERVSPAPMLERGPHDAYLTTSPWVLHEGGRWRMWYTSGTGWRDEGGRPKHWYHVKYAESDDGVTWDRRGVVAIDFASPDEYAISRPCVVRDSDRYRMWFSCRGPAYRIGYAESEDGVAWRRDDAAAGLAPSGGDWDATMVEYPCVFDRRGRRSMLYNGDGYGATGVGLAEWEAT